MIEPINQREVVPEQLVSGMVVIAPLPGLLAVVPKDTTKYRPGPRALSGTHSRFLETLESLQREWEDVRELCHRNL